MLSNKSNPEFSIHSTGLEEERCCRYFTVKQKPIHFAVNNFWGNHRNIKNMHIYNTPGLSVLKQSRLQFQQSPNCSLGEFLRCPAPHAPSLPRHPPGWIISLCLVLCQQSATTAENQLDLTGIYASWASMENKSLDCFLFYPNGINHPYAAIA